MPTTLPGIGPGKAAELLQQTDRIIKTFPEVARVFGKVGRAESATDPAPLEMIETTIQFKPRSEWRPGMTLDKLIAEMDAATRLPGLSNVWVQPIRNRIDMLATGIKSPVGIKVAGADLAEIDRLAARIEQVVKARARRHLGAGRAPRRRALCRGAHPPARRGALWALGGRRAGGGVARHRRREHRRDRRRAGALSDQHPLSARAARFASASCARCPSSPRAAPPSRSNRWPTWWSPTVRR